MAAAAVGAGFAGLSALISLSGKIETMVNKLHERTDLTKDNIDQLDRVLRRFADARALFRQLGAVAAHDPITTTRLQEFETTLENDLEALEPWQHQIRTAKRRARVKRIKQVLDQCETHVNDLFEFLSAQVSPMLETSAKERVRYIPRNTVPVNPPRLTLDYSTTGTTEGELMAAVLAPGEGRIVALVATGKGGAGKTCALRGLASDQQIKDNFPGGTLYIQLGNDSKLADVTEGVAKIVERTGAPELAEKIRLTETLQDACDKASDWFHAHKCLFLVDDIWRVDGIDSNVFDALASIVNESSRLVYTTRDRHFQSRANKVIEFKEKEAHGELAKRMLLKHAEFDNHDDWEDKNKVAFEAILRECQGLPLAFGIAGGAVLKQARRKSSERRQDAWSDFYEDMKRSPGHSKLLESHAEQYGALRRIVDVSIHVLEKRHGPGNFQKHFRALCVLRKQQSAPLRMLQRLWGLKSLEETEALAEVLGDASVVQVVDHDGVVFVLLHDLMLDIALSEASKRFETQSFYESLMTNYVLFQNDDEKPSLDDVRPDEVVAGTEGEGRVQFATASQEVLGQCPTAGTVVEPGRSTFHRTFRIEWWKMSDDGYLHNNLCRLLREAGHSDTLLWLLSQPHWIAIRLCNGGIYQLEQDLQLGKSVLSRTAPSTRGHEEHLEIIGKAARLSNIFVNENPAEIWFQLCGRLLWHARENERTRAFVERIESCARRPWVKASEGILQQASKGTVGIIHCKIPVWFMRIEGEEVWYVDERFSASIAKYNLRTGSRKSIDTILPPEVSGRSMGLQDVVFPMDHSSIVGVTPDLTIVVWSSETGEVKRFVKCKEGMWLAGVKNLRRYCGMISSCLGPSGTDAELQSSTVRGRVIAIIANGTMVACEYKYYIIRLFDTESGEAVGPPLRGHTDWVLCVTMSEDGSRIVSGSRDNTVRVWDARSGEAVGPPLRGHTDWVKCVTMSEDGSRIVSGSLDKTVRVWDARSGEAVGPPLRGHTDSVLCVTMSEDGSRIVSGSHDNTVRVWDARSGVGPSRVSLAPRSRGKTENGHQRRSADADCPQTSVRGSGFFIK